MPNAPVISIIIPAYNEAKYISRGLEAAAASIARQRLPTEIIVVDNASDDATVEIAEKTGARVVREEKHIIAAVRNTGAHHAKGTFLIFIDADSAMHPDTVDVIGGLLERKEVIGGCAEVYPEKWNLKIWAGVVFIKAIVYGLLRLGGGLYFCAKEDFDECGRFDETLYAAEDLDFAKRLKALGRKRGLNFVRLSHIPITTSMRKMDMISTWKLIGIVIRGALSPIKLLRDPDYWKCYFYDGKLR